MESIKQILMRRDGLSDHEAGQLIAEAEIKLYQYLSEGDEINAYNICQEFFGLEPDYLDELL